MAEAAVLPEIPARVPDAARKSFTSRVPPESSGLREKVFNHFAGPVQRDRGVRRDWVYEHAETGNPLVLCGLQL